MENRDSYTPAPLPNTTGKGPVADGVVSRGFHFSDLRLALGDIERVLRRKVERWLSETRSSLLYALLGLWLASIATMMLLFAVLAGVLAASGAIEIVTFTPLYIVGGVTILLFTAAYFAFKTAGGRERAAEEPSPQLRREKRAETILESRLNIISTSFAESMNPIRILGKFIRRAAPLVVTASLVVGRLLGRRERRVHAAAPQPAASGMDKLKGTVKNSARNLAIEFAGAVVIPIIAQRLLSELSKNGHRNGNQHSSRDRTHHSG